LGLLGLAATNFLYSHSAYAGSPDLQRWKQVTHDKTNEFMNEHLVVPVRTIYSELFNQNSIDFDQMALEVQLNRESVAKMMNEFAKRKFTNPADLDKARKSIAGGDTQWMLEEHEKDVSSPWGALITGDLIQSLMIQLQKLKLEIDEEMLQMDKLIKANEINLQLAATFPILSLLYTGYQATLVFFRYWQHRNFRKLYGRNRPWSHASAQLRRIARILSMRQHTYVQEFYDQGYYLYGLMKLHEVATLELRGSERRQLLEDLADLRSLNLDTQAKLLVTNRMYRNY
jgi:nuclear-control-of-ATPase protein 2